MDPLKKEFTDLLKRTGWNQTEAAERLRITRSAVNHLLNPKHKNRPSDRTLFILKSYVDAIEQGIPVSDFDNEKTAEKTEQNRVSGVPKKEAQERVMRYPFNEDAGGKVVNENYVETMVKEVREIAKIDPSKARELAGVISSYKELAKRRSSR